MRLVNHAESATSSNALTLADSPAGSTAKMRASGRKAIWLAPSHTNGDSYGSGVQIFFFFVLSLSSSSSWQGT